jgi:hypothetical protein
MLIGLLLLGFAPVISNGQDEHVRGAVATKTGLLIVWNEPQNNFTIQIRGKAVERVQNKNLAFLIDGKFIQIVTAFNKDFLGGAQSEQKLDEKAILLAHRDWESKYLRETVGEKLTVDSEEISLSDGKPALLWSFLTPEKDREKVKRQVFLTVCKGESVLVLNGAETSEIDRETVRRFLLETIATLKIRKGPLSRADAVELASKTN